MDLERGPRMMAIAIPIVVFFVVWWQTRQLRGTLDENAVVALLSGASWLLRGMFLVLGVAAIFWVVEGTQGWAFALTAPALAVAAVAEGVRVGLRAGRVPRIIDAA